MRPVQQLKGGGRCDDAIGMSKGIATDGWQFISSLDWGLHELRGKGKLGKEYV